MFETKSRISALMLFLALAAGNAVAQDQASGPQIAGCPMFPTDHILNTPIDRLPLDPNSDAYVATIGPDRPVHPDFGTGLAGIPFTTIAGTQRRVPVTFEYPRESDPGPYPIPPNPPIEGGSQSTGDRHILLLDRDNCVLYELWYAFPNPDGSWRAGAGAIFHLRSNALRPDGWTSADAAGLSIVAGLVRYEEVVAGEIQHAIRFTAPQTRNTYVWPATHYASRLSETRYPPMGQRFRLKGNFDVSGFARPVQVILRAMKKYGIILSDNGSSWYITGAPDERWDNEILRQLRNVTGSSFEAVDSTPLMISPRFGQARQWSPKILNGATLQPGALSPGQIVTIVGSEIGPPEPMVWRLTPDGRVDTQLGDSLVLFRGLRAPLLYVSADQINAIVPYGIAGSATADIEVAYRNRIVLKESLPIFDAWPGVFTVDYSGAGPARALNEDSTWNSPANPAAPGSLVTFFGTGEGLTEPASADGQVWGAAAPKFRLPVSVQIAGRNAELAYAGSAPQAVAGLFQVNARVPSQTPSGSASLQLRVGNYLSPGGVTIAVR